MVSTFTGIMTTLSLSFRPNSSIQCALISLISHINSSMDSNINQSTYLLSIDLQKAFDMVNHDKLLDLIINSNIPDTLKDLLQDYLKDRYQCVFFKNQINTYLPILSGVPQ